jgi:hypothetical protein
MANSPEPFGRMIEPIEFYKITCPQPSPHLGEGMGRGRNFETTPRNLRVAVGNWQTTLGHEIALDGDTESPQSLPEISPPFGGGTPFSSRGFRSDSPNWQIQFRSYLKFGLSTRVSTIIRQKIWGSSDYFPRYRGTKFGALRGTALREPPRRRPSTGANRITRPFREVFALQFPPVALAPTRGGSIGGLGEVWGGLQADAAETKAQYWVLINKKTCRTIAESRPGNW